VKDRSRPCQIQLFEDKGKGQPQFFGAIDIPIDKLGPEPVILAPNLVVAQVHVLILQTESVHELRGMGAFRIRMFVSPVSRSWHFLADRPPWCHAAIFACNAVPNWKRRTERVHGIQLALARAQRSVA